MRAYRTATNIGEASRQPIRSKNKLPSSHTDTGCPDGFLPSCLNCPLAACRDDVPGGLMAIIAENRAEAVKLARALGKTVEQIIEELSVSKRTARRLLEEP